MKAKKVLGLLLAASMVTGLLAGCGKDESGQPSGRGESQQESGGQESGG